MNTTTSSHDPARERLNKIETWKIFGHLSFIRPVPEEKRIRLFLLTLHQLARRIKTNPNDLRWVLKQEGDFINKLYHFHFLLDGSNLENKDSGKLADNFAKLWAKVGGGDCDVCQYHLDRDENGYQRAVNYITKLEGHSVPFSIFFNAGDKCHLKFSDGLDKHLAAICSTYTTQIKRKIYD